MPKITSIEPQKKNPKRFNVFLDGVFAFGADEDTIVNFRLILGKNIEEKDLDKIVLETQVGKLMEKMYGLFGIRGRSEKEIRDYLKRKNFQNKIKDKEETSELVVERLIEVLKQKGMLNDLEFTKSWIESRSKSKGLSVIKTELFKKGISRDIIEEVLGDQRVEVGDQKQIALKLLEKRLQRFNSFKKAEQRKKAMEFLLRRGFDYSLVKEVVNEIIGKDYELSLEDF